MVQRAPGVHPILSLAFCYSLYIICRLVLYQFFLAILLKEFDKVNLQTKVARAEENKNKSDFLSKLMT